MRKIFAFILLFVLPCVFLVFMFFNFDTEDNKLEELKEEYAKEDPMLHHQNLEELDIDFSDPHQVTAACLECHEHRAMEIMATSHWTWERAEYIEGRGVVYYGKKNAVNNFCTGIAGSEQSCNRCHIGYGWGDKDFDFTNPNNVDCLVCHDGTNTYRKASGMAGYPALEGDAMPDYNNVLDNITLPNIANCGICHFYSSGGNNIKQGTLDNALLTCDEDVDVHMANSGANLDCQDCHTAENHDIQGQYYGVSSMNKERVECAQCHTEQPHNERNLNNHTENIACQTCHIPTYAKATSTKMTWDWSAACKLKDGKPYEEIDSLGNHTYMSIKGAFTFANNVEPEYLWFNGTANHHLYTDDIVEIPVQINTLYGSADDGKSKIYPVKVHRGKQAYDPINNKLVQPKLWDKDSGQNALWVDLNFDSAIVAGMDYMDLPYSGTYDFIETEMYLPVSHMVSKSEDALGCEECHVREDGRLESLSGFYMPGRDRVKIIDIIGFLLILLALAAASIHGTIRIVTSRKFKNTH